MATLLTNRIGCLIPMYIYATSQLFDQIISAKASFPNVPIGVIINPDNGPGTFSDVNFTNLITRLKNAGCIVLGYLYTNYGNNSLASVEAGIDAYRSFYPAIDGIFFGGMSNQTTMKSYYKTLDTYAKTTKGFATTAGEVGAKVPTDFLNGGTVDTCVVYIGAGLPVATLYADYDTYPNSNVGILAFGISAVNQTWISQINVYVGWIYTTSDSGINPWDSLPSYFSSLISYLDSIGGGTPPPSAAVDKFGVHKMYYTKAGGEEWFVDMANPTSDARFQNEPTLTRVTETNGSASWQCSGGASSYQVRLEAWSPAYSDMTLRKNARWKNVEITAYCRVDSLLIDPAGFSYVFQWYSRGGHHFAPTSCEGSALKASLQDNGTLALRKEINHPAYTTRTFGSSNIPQNDLCPLTLNGPPGKWLGMKAVIYNIIEGGNTHTIQELWLDKNCSDVENNLVMQNNWQLMATNKDSGGWSTSDTDFLGNCTPLDIDSNLTYRQRDEILNDPGGSLDTTSGNYNRNLVSWRTDGLRWRWKYLSAREIDPTKPVGSGGTPPPLPPPTEPSSVFDNFGVRKVYPTRISPTAGHEWYMNTLNILNDTHFNSTNTFSKNADGSYKCRDAAVRINVYQSGGYNSANSFTGSQDHSQTAARGYIQDTNDWRNVEMTGYVRINSLPTTDKFMWYTRGGRHYEPQPSCEGTALIAALYSTGSTILSKEQYHLAQVDRPSNNQIGSSIVGQWIGFKHIVYNKNVAGIFVTKQEIYVDINNDNTWIKVDETTDAGSWGNQDTVCHGLADQKVLWGGPIIIFRWDTFTDVDFKFLSIREIDGDATPVDPNPPPAPGSCGSP